MFAAIMRCQLARQVEHPHKKTFPDLIIVAMGHAASDRAAAPDRSGQLRPALHQMVVMHDDMPEITWRGADKMSSGKSGQSIAAVRLEQKAERRQGIEEHGRGPRIGAAALRHRFGDLLPLCQR